MKIKIRDIYNFIGVFLLCALYFFETPISLLGTQLLIVLQIGITLCFIMAASVHGRISYSKKVYPYTLMWIMMIPFFLYGLLHSEKMVVFRILFGIIVCLFLATQDDWINNLKKMLLLFSGSAVFFPGKFGAYFTTLTRVAVPIFFMITGYFYGDTVARHKENRQIRKIFYLVVRANSIFFIWNIALGILKRDSIVTYVRKIFTGKSILKFLVLNESPLAGHLWYLGAILYVLVIVLLVDRFNCKKVLYYLTPVLLIADLVFGKYSLLIFHREFPYILVRNFLCVGIPYFCIGNLIREKRCSEKWNRKILQVLIVVFTITSLAERFVLVSAGLNATRDHYLSTTFLAICLFVYTLKSNWHNKGLAVIGRKCSTWLYIIHPIFITAFSVATGKLGIKSIYRCVAPIVTYCATLTFLIVMCRLKSLLVKNNQRK